MILAAFLDSHPTPCEHVLQNHVIARLWGARSYDTVRAMGQFASAVQAWRSQELAQFARRAHAQLGRGFVLVESDNPKPVYVTHILGAPPLLVAAVCDYDPAHEALLVCDDNEDFIISRVRIDRQH